MSEQVASRIDIDVRTTGADEATRSLEKLATAENSVVVVSEKQQKARERSEAAAERLAKKYDAEYRAVQQLARDQAALNRAYEAGLGNTVAYEKALVGVQKQQEMLRQSANDNAKSAGLARHEWTNLSRQLQDVGTMLASGSSPTQVLATQGAQIYDIFSSSRSGAGAALKDFGATALRFLANPATLGVAAVGAATLAWMQWREQIYATTIALNGLGRQSGLTVSQIDRIARASAGPANISTSAASGVANQMLSAGVSGSSIGGAIGLSATFGRGLGMSLDDAAKELAQALADPARGADDLAKKYGLVSFAEREHIKELAAIGDKSGATSRLLAELSKTIGEMEDPTSRLQKVWDTLKKGFWDGVDKWGRLIDRAIDGPAATANREQERQAKADELARRAQAERDAERADELSRLREDSALATREVLARSYAEREAVAIEKSRTLTLRETHDAVRASIAAESERAKLLAESARKVEDLARTSKDSLSLASLTPYERRMKEIDISERDFRRENIPDAATPMVREFDTAATAARNVSSAFDGLVEKIGGTGAISGSFGRLIPLSEWQNGQQSASDPRGLSPYIRDRAAAYGVNPDIALRVARSEGLRTFSGDHGTSFGAFQLHVGGGVGDEFRKATGLDPSDPANEKSTIDYALKIAAKRGWGPWHGAARVGIGEWEGIRASGTNLSAQTASAFGDQRAAARYEFVDAKIKESSVAIAEQNRLLDTQRVALTADNSTLSGVIESQKLLNYFTTQRITVDDELRRKIIDVGEAEAQRARKEESIARDRRRYIEDLDFARGGVSSTLSGAAKAAANGKDVGQAALQSLTQLRDNAIDMMTSRLTEGLLGQTGTTGGGLLGGLLGFGDQKSVGMMTVSAANVVVNGGVGGGLSGIGGTGGIGGKLFSGVTGFFSNLFGIGANADGTDNWRGGPTWVGERGPEIVNLPRGAQVVPNAEAVAYARSLGSGGGSNGGPAKIPPMTFVDQSHGVTVTPRMSDGQIMMLIENRIASNNKKTAEAPYRAA